MSKGIDVLDTLTDAENELREYAFEVADDHAVGICNCDLKRLADDVSAARAAVAELMEAAEQSVTSMLDSGYSKNHLAVVRMIAALRTVSDAALRAARGME